MYRLVKRILNRTCQLIALPFAALCWLEKTAAPQSEVVFQFWSHLYSVVPGLPGVFLRRAFYSLTLDHCSLECYIGFGSVFSHRRAVVEDHVYLGLYSIIGSAHLGKKTLIGSRVSILSGKALHVRDDQGQWTPFDPDRIQQVTVGPNVWVGEGALIMANVGEGSLVGAGAVVTANVRDNIIVGGNPARFIRKLDVAESPQDVAVSN